MGEMTVDQRRAHWPCPVGIEGVRRAMSNACTMALSGPVARSARPLSAALNSPPPQGRAVADMTFERRRRFTRPGHSGSTFARGVIRASPLWMIGDSPTIINTHHGPSGESWPRWAHIRYAE